MTTAVAAAASVPASSTAMNDRPFVFLLRDIPTGAILFVGRVVDPTA